MLADLVLQRGHRGVLQHPGMVEEDALGPPGGAAGVDDAEVVIGPDVVQGGRRCRRTRGHQGSVRLPLDVQHLEVVLLGHLGCLGEVLGIAQQQARPGVVHDLVQFDGTEAEVEPHVDGARLGDPAEHLHDLGAVRHEQRHPVAGLDAERAGQGVGDAVRPLLQLRPGHVTSLRPHVEQRGPVRVAHSVAPEGQADVHAGTPLPLPRRADRPRRPASRDPRAVLAVLTRRPPQRCDR